MQEKTCCFVGYGEIPADKLDEVRRELEREIGAALEGGYRTFLTGFTEGAGILFARLVNGRRGEYPDIFLEVILHPKHCERFSRDEWELLSKSTALKVLCEECRQDYPLHVTRYLVELSSRVIAVCGGQADSDTLYAMDYANTMERELHIVNI